MGVLIPKAQHWQMEVASAGIGDYSVNMHRRFGRWILGILIACLSGCATSDDFVCGGSYKSEAEMERAFGVKPSAGSDAQTVRY